MGVSPNLRLLDYTRNNPCTDLLGGWRPAPVAYGVAPASDGGAEAEAAGHQGEAGGEGGMSLPPYGPL